MKVPANRRAGFTLMELIVVIGIILLLMALTLSAVFRVREARMETNTNTHLRKLDIGFMQQWNAMMDTIKKEPIPQSVKEATRNANGSYDTERAKAMHMMLRMRQEFPGNFGEAQDVYTTNGYPNGAQPYTYGPKPFFKLAYGNPVLTGSENEAAAMLFLILSMGHGGVSFNADQAAPTTVLSFTQQGNPTPPPVQLKVFVDEWGTPISFRRMADDDSTMVLTDLNQPPFVTPSQVASGLCNPFDPQGRLPVAGWPEQQKMFQYFQQTNINMRPYILNPFDNKNRGPYVFSAGKDKNWYPPFDQDNLYSYRLQQSGKGN
jgi:prepilin-type N-terminal cleavage/methylation domain-containing protein